MALESGTGANAPTPACSARTKAVCSAGKQVLILTGVSNPNRGVRDKSGRLRGARGPKVFKSTGKKPATQGEVALGCEQRRFTLSRDGKLLAYLANQPPMSPASRQPRTAFGAWVSGHRRSCARAVKCSEASNKSICSRRLSHASKSGVGRAARAAARRRTSAACSPSTRSFSCTTSASAKSLSCSPTRTSPSTTVSNWDRIDGTMVPRRDPSNAAGQSSHSLHTICP